MKKLFNIEIGLGALELLALIIFNDKLPTRMPIHWNLSGQVDGYASKWSILLLPLIAITATLVARHGARVDANGQVKDTSGKIVPLTSLFITVIILAVAPITIAVTDGLKFPIEGISLVTFGILFMILGNYAPKVRRNKVLGFRFPWVMNDDILWDKTQRFGGAAFLLAGVVIVLTVFLSEPINLIVASAALILSIISTVIYSLKIKGEK
ncbi:MAG: DUF1648 domain-containing protein [Lactobacillales bacterium]|jgi:uncharacterized membrane protein|nr:DUF1648 domain-containing protein [Lactobacillales bacterium]